MEIHNYNRDEESVLSDNLKKFYNIIERYRCGEFGNSHLSLSEILSAAGEKELIYQMNASEINYMIEHSTGMLKMLFLELQKYRKTDVLGESQATLVKKKNNE